jgi:hypothetical protein
VEYNLGEQHIPNYCSQSEFILQKLPIKAEATAKRRARERARVLFIYNLYL